jgi:hypothetical protein
MHPPTNINPDCHDIKRGVFSKTFFFSKRFLKTTKLTSRKRKSATPGTRRDSTKSPCFRGDFGEARNLAFEKTYQSSKKKSFFSKRFLKT